MLNRFQQGEHICAIYDSQSEQLAMAAEYLSDGLRRGEQVLYVAATQAELDGFCAELNRSGINTAAMRKKGALKLATHADAHLVGGYFESERMLRLLNEMIEVALADGFTGLRTCGDMSWLLEKAPGSEQIVVYESLLNQLFTGVPAAGMCQYDRRRLPADLLDHALATHPSALLACRHRPNRFYRPTEVSTARTAQPSDVPWKLAELRRHA